MALSQQFYGWVFALGGGVEILSPEAVRQEFKEEISKFAAAYE